MVDYPKSPSIRALWVLISISLAYNTFDFVTSNEMLSEQLNYVSSQKNALIQLQNDVSEFEYRISGLERNLNSLENSLERNMKQTSDLEWDLFILENNIQGEISNIQYDLQNHTFFDH